MDRRTFFGSAAAGVLAYQLAARAQQPGIPLIGFVRSSSLDDAGKLVAAFRQGLKETGFIEGQNVAIEYRSADDRYEKLPQILGDLLQRHASVLVANAIAAQAAKAATSTVPIVFATGGDPVRDKLVTSLNRPGENITGVSFFTAALGAKKFELVRELVPTATTVAVLENPTDRASQAEGGDVVTAARTVGQRIAILRVGSEGEFEQAFASIVREHAGALLVTGDALFYSRRDKLIALAARNAIPTIYYLRDFVTDGGLISYGASITDAYRQVGVYTGRILKGEKPAQLPIIQPTNFELVINLKTAKALALNVAPSLLVRADEVIQ
jgi:ABC-type uncharacterized transport system substrate-binding protein